MISPRELRFHRYVFVASAIYNTIWGTFVVLFPLLPFRWAGLPDPNYPELWQCIGMIVGVYAIGYAYLAADPIRYAPFLIVAFLGKIFGPIGWLIAWHNDRLPGITGLTILTNDLIWWIPYGRFLWMTMGPGARQGSR
ncbi:hypothetical protein [Humisphaera borealis]|uniref:Alkyl hydroperoxide reductase n=1 Tax=Humisphaera borealis TaxID=2807512 RepID=A0A7M2WR70_9BACT|nr:hypothetical protein [Humisphaera borealis]QOV87899.1 alkyl hydroperoxide reductase [Humisphaera borealis]